MREGAADYVLKPVQLDEILMRVNRAMEMRDLVRQRRQVTAQLAEDSTFSQPGGQEPADDETL